MRYFGVTKVPNDKFQHTFQIELFDSYIFYSLVINNQDHEHASDDDDVIRERMRSCMWTSNHEHACDDHDVRRESKRSFMTHNSTVITSQ